MLALRDYQLEAVEAVRREYVANKHSTLLCMATGTGKTVTCGGMLLGMKERGKRALFVAHSGELLDQAARTFTQMGLSVGYEKAARKVEPNNLPDVVLASVQSLKGARLNRFDAKSFSLVVVDEGHHAAASTYVAVLDHFHFARVLGLSATPDRGDGKPLSEVYDSIAYRLEMPEAISRGFLCQLELMDVAIESLDLDSIKTKAGDYDASALQAEILKDATLHGMAKPLVDHYRDRKTIAFLPGVESAHGFADILRGHGLSAIAVDGSMKEADRRAALEAYASGEARVICNADLLLEGYDHPPTDCIAICRPTRSRARLVQMIGRGARLSPGKAKCVVVNFVPGTVKAQTFLAPEDALAGAFSVMGSIGKTYKKTRDEEQARLAAEEYAARLANERKVKSIGVHFAITRMPVQDFLDAMAVSGSRDPHGDELPAEWQLVKLANAGLSKADLKLFRTRAQASAFLDAAAKRRERGLCTYSQAKRLQRYGYPDTLTADQASQVMGQLADNRWHPIESKDQAARRFESTWRAA